MSYANAPIVLNVRDRTAGQYNNAQFNANNQNIIQGDIREIAVSEVNFPYDIPNMQAGYNTFELLSATIPTGGLVGSTPGDLTITIAPGFYTGVELQNAINAEILAQQLSVGGNPDDMPTIDYSASSNRFTFVAPASDAVTPTWSVFSAYTYPVGYNAQRNTLGKDILSIMGFLTYPPDIPEADKAGYSAVSADPALNKPVFTGQASAPMAFTQYIDICSPQMCKYQYFRDGSTTNLARRADVICRLFICDNVSLTTDNVEGSRPFIINRQYVNARIMRWTTENSVGTIDVQLYDDIGQPLTTTWQPRPYQITFNCYERSVEGDKEKDETEGGGGGAPRYASYQERNVSKAWKNLGRQ